MLDEPTTNWTVISFPRKGKEIKEKKSWVPARRQNFYLNFFFFSHLELVGDPEKKKVTDAEWWGAMYLSTLNTLHLSTKLLVLTTPWRGILPGLPDRQTFSVGHLKPLVLFMEDHLQVFKYLCTYLGTAGHIKTVYHVSIHLR